MESCTESKRKIENLCYAERVNRKYFRRHEIDGYIPGQATYHLGDYPNRFSIMPTDYDREELSRLADAGVGLIQIHEEWNDSIRVLGADKLTSHDPAGLRAFVDLCHEYGIKVIPYISTGYFPANDPDFREEFTRIPHALRGDYFIYKRCYAGSTAWREYLLPRTFRALDDYGFDGIYNDWGYDGMKIAQLRLIEEGKSVADITKYDLPYDPVLEDLLLTVYREVKRRGGVYKIHADKNNVPPCKEKVYDYLWIGENVGISGVGVGKDYEPYIVPCRHGAFTEGESAEDYFARVIPFMQFPLLKRGRHFNPKPIDPALVVNSDSGDAKHKARVMEYMKDHPDGPYVFSLWSSVPDDEEELPRFARYYALYSPMVTRGSVAYIELRECGEILSKIPENVYASMFINEECYLAVSNLGAESYTLDLRGVWRDRESGEVSKSFTLGKNKIRFLVKIG